MGLLRIFLVSLVLAPVVVIAAGLGFLQYKAASAQTSLGYELREFIHRAAGHGFTRRLASRFGYVWAADSRPDYPLFLTSTAFYELRVRSRTLPWTSGPAALEQIGDHLLVASRYGDLQIVNADGSLDRLEAIVPMNLAAFQQTRAYEVSDKARRYFRVTDLLAVPQEGAQVDLYISHEHYGDGCVGLRISRLRLIDDADGLRPDTGSFETLTEGRPCTRPEWYPIDEWIPNSTGGRMILLDDDHLLWSLGSHAYGGLVARNLAPADVFGDDVTLMTMQKVNLRTGESTTFSSGHRNPRGLLRTRDGRIWSTEHGPQGGDELNLIVEGKEYGWPQVTLGVDYDSRVWPLNPVQGRHEAYAQPVFAWLPSIAVNQIVEMAGPEFPIWDGDLMMITLKNQALHRLRLEGERVQYIEPIDLGARLRDILRLEDGRLVILDEAMRLIFIENAASAPVARFMGDDSGAAATQHAVTGAADGAQLFAQNCAACHALTPANGIGPHLDGLFDRSIGGAAAFAYTASLRAADEPWSRERLTRFLRRPARVMPGTSMAPAPLSPREADAVVDYLYGRSAARGTQQRAASGG
ncbi:MAG: PQQ-dependent sugar dehydrogenase [Geminicoccaceae bacterium]